MRPETARPLLPRQLHHFEVIDSGCWQWTGSFDGRYNYGRASLTRPGTTRRRWIAHRLVYEFLIGRIPDGMQLDHLCKNRGCVNPDHLEPVTALENVRRSAAADYWRAKTHCPREHPYDEANTGYTKRGGRICRACARDKMRERRGTKPSAFRTAA